MPLEFQGHRHHVRCGIRDVPLSSETRHERILSLFSSMARTRYSYVVNVARLGWLQQVLMENTRRGRGVRMSVRFNARLGYFKR